MESFAATVATTAADVFNTSIDDLQAYLLGIV